MSVRTWLDGRKADAAPLPPTEGDQLIIIEALNAANDDDLDELQARLDRLVEENSLTGPLRAIENLLRLRCSQQLGHAQPFASTRSEEHTSELQSLLRTSSA